MKTVLFVILISILAMPLRAQDSLVINDQEYLEMTGLNVMLAHDFYPESHQGGVGIIQNGLRIGTNGDIRLEPAPGQWQPVPKVGKRVVDRNTREISVRMEYPDPGKNRKGFNPIIYPDLNFAYTLKIKPEGKSFRIIVDLDKAIPDEWIGKVGFNFELFPGILFGKSFYIGETGGIFPRQANGPMLKDADGEIQIAPMGEGRKLVVAPESDQQRMIIENLSEGNLLLIDGRGKHNNGWFVVRSMVAKGATTKAVEWLVTPHAIPGWLHEPVVQVSQVGYHPKQDKLAVIEIDLKEKQRHKVSLLRASQNGGMEVALEATPKEWGKFLRYQYLQFDFTAVTKPGMYVVKYGNYQTEPFQIDDKIYQRNVWQPTLEYFLPAQMCHMRINERYRVWHGACHLDDARMAQLDVNHFDGYVQGKEPLQTKFKPGETVPGLDQGGWHDAGDFDLRIESQAETVHMLALMYERFNLNYDNTTIDQKNRLVEIQQPDGKDDFLQQIEHGALPIVAGYQSLGRLYRGVICPTLRQYVLLGDPLNMTDNKPFSGPETTQTPPVGLPGSPDDRWVFTESNPSRELQTAAALAAASRALKSFNPKLSQACLEIATSLWLDTKEKDPLQRLSAAVELFRTTNDKKYSEWILTQKALLIKNIGRTASVVGPVLSKINDKRFKDEITGQVKLLRKQIDAEGLKSPYGMPYEPDIWGAGWGIQAFGVDQFFLHDSYPEIFDTRYMLHALNFVLGCHPGSNTSSFVSGVGSRSLTTAYGFNRADWSYIPGGSASGTALIRPDYPELLTWPFLWQQTEYVLGGGTTDYMFLVLAAEFVLNKKGQ